MLAFLAQAIGDVPVEHQVPGFLQRFLEFIDTPAPYSPFSEYLLILFVLWFLARRSEKKKDFSAEAQQVLDEKFKRGELDRISYEKYRQELSMRVKKD
ncbi:MAG: hypothetical protein ACT4O1_13290 [Gemmatimonadota bacterium]